MTHHQAEGLWLPLTLAQMDFWEEFRFHPGEAVSTVAHVIELRGVADPEALAGAITATIAETDIMALRFGLGADGRPVQRVDPAQRPRLRHLDLSDRADAREHALALMQADVDAALDLLDRPIAAQWLIRLAEGHYLWFNRGHHIALDGYAMGLIERRCAQLYAALAKGADPGQPLRPLADYLNEETDYRASPRHAADGRHWAEVLAARPRPRVLRKGSEDYPAEALCAAHDLSALRPALMRQAQAVGMGWPDLLTVLCSAWAALHLRDGSAERLADDHGRIAMPVWLPYMSRMGSVAVSVPALVVNILPLDVTLHPAEPLGEALARLGGRQRKLRRHGRYRIEQIAEDYGMEPRSRFFFSPLINVLPFDEARFAGCETARHVLSNGPGDGFNITIRGDGEAQGLELLVEADPTLTPPEDFARLSDGLPRFLSAALVPENLPLPLAGLPG
ncbi:condensation domain-containing protein [Paracoccus sp. SSJ]|uniref:condensation domain-containing protein n=1 Tax=Paracoccus sp. SSJ TaxID=3050636 RepID=UPI00254BD52C|nr:condensation domain-containing protein [Paracoccus sp. SSJ]MDK8874091.1 condensation domain-containing protein [Paracoccus sp. SSJ]